MPTPNQKVSIPIGNVILEGNLQLPTDAKGIILFAHGSGSSRFSPRNQFVANYLVQNQLATLLIDLLTTEEEIMDDQTRELRFNIEFLAKRLMEVTQWLQNNAMTKHLPVGYFGASTGGAAALVAAAYLPQTIFAVVSRGGRPDLAEASLLKVKAPTLLIVGGEDTIVITLNEQAMELLSCPKKMETIPGATHLFEEPGALNQVAALACKWFLNHL